MSITTVGRHMWGIIRLLSDTERDLPAIVKFLVDCLMACYKCTTFRAKIRRNRRKRWYQLFWPTLWVKYKKLTDILDRRTLPPERHRCKTLLPLYSIWRIATFSAQRGRIVQRRNITLSLLLVLISWPRSAIYSIVFNTVIHLLGVGKHRQCSRMNWHLQVTQGR